MSNTKFWTVKYRRQAEKDNYVDLLNYARALFCELGKFKAELNCPRDENVSKYFDDKAYENQARAAGYGDLLDFTKLYYAHVFRKATIEVLNPINEVTAPDKPVIQNSDKQKQSKPSHRPTTNTPTVKSQVIVLHFGMLSYRKIVKEMRRVHNFSISYSSVRRIIKEYEDKKL